MQSWPSSTAELGASESTFGTQQDTGWPGSLSAKRSNAKRTHEGYGGMSAFVLPPVRIAVGHLLFRDAMSQHQFQCSMCALSKTNPKCISDRGVSGMLPSR